MGASKALSRGVSIGTAFGTSKLYLVYSRWRLLVSFRSKICNCIALPFYKLVNIINCNLWEVVHLLGGWVEGHGKGRDR